ncbi:hypothetical protein KKF91_10740 [Myxococcota bacterium]|nr:hypothetical protein [Myxococcota bacterium]MBU1431008.1 hypothetical protein [Myxococcota bacterium]MBU1898443.1 hypothetical protein [Myxococcota bacterium]
MLWTLSLCAALLLSAPAATGGDTKGPIQPVMGPPPATPNQVIARSRVFMRLDPSARPAPDGAPVPSAVGSFQLRSLGDVDVEASGWVGHAPGAASRDDQAISGDITSLLYRWGAGPLKLTLGRQWSSIGGQRYTALDGATARLSVGSRVEIAARVGLAGQEPRDAFGATQEAGGEIRLKPLRGATIGLGVIHQALEDVPSRTRWTLALDYAPSPWWSASSAATADVDAQALVDGRLELAARPWQSVWLRSYARHVRVDLMLAPDEMLALFVEDVRDEAGLVVEHLISRAWRAHLDGGLVQSKDRPGASRWRGGLAFRPRGGAAMGLDGAVRVDRLGYSTSGRLFARYPLRQTAYLTGEALQDAAAAPGDAVEYASLTRLGVGFEPWAGWLAHGAVEAAASPRWSHRLAAMVLLEYAHGAPVRWGGAR